MVIPSCLKAQAGATTRDSPPITSEFEGALIPSECRRRATIDQPVSTREPNGGRLSLGLLLHGRGVGAARHRAAISPRGAGARARADRNPGRGLRLCVACRALAGRRDLPASPSSSVVARRRELLGSGVRCRPAGQRCAAVRSHHGARRSWLVGRDDDAARAARRGPSQGSQHDRGDGLVFGLHRPGTHGRRRARRRHGRQAGVRSQLLLTRAAHRPWDRDSRANGGAGDAPGAEHGPGSRSAGKHGGVSRACPRSCGPASW